MPGTWNGIGTTFIGAKDRYPDNSFITTEWFVVLTFPLIPIKSRRVMFLENSVRFRRASSDYTVAKEVPLDLQQVLTTYFVAFASIASGVWLFFTIMDSFAYTDWGPIVGIVSFFVPYFIAQLLFFNAK